MTGTAATMDIEENMAIALRRGEKRTLRWGVSREDRELFREKLQTLGLGLEDRMTSKVGLLSGGQRQAITLLMAALKQPKLLLLDEHTAALDPKTAAKVLEISDKIIEETGVKIDISDDGIVKVCGTDEAMIDRAIAIITGIVTDIEAGMVFTG